MSTKKLGEDTIQITIYIKKDLLKLIDEYWHKNKLKNRNIAIKELIKRGLKK
jgi:metal-responsive CopG/Arc/MetJ family transcriptional regulator